MGKYKRDKLCTVITRWVPVWRSENKLDGKTRHFMLWGPNPLDMHAFRTRRECEKWINDEYGYLRHRTDLRDEPHGWRMPKAAKVFITIQTVHACP